MRIETFPPHNTSTVLSTALIVIFVSAYLSLGHYAHAQDSDSRATLFLSPRTNTILVGSTFDVSFFVDTRGAEINTVDLKLKFPSTKLSIVEPSGGKSFISQWVKAPTYSNVYGTASFMGVIPNGFTADSGLVTRITFRALEPGEANIEVLPSSRVLAHDGIGSDILELYGRGDYTIIRKPPAGVRIFSDTHPFEGDWYNNNNIVLTWDKSEGITDFSYTLDNLPLTVPDNIPDTKNTIVSYEDMGDGTWHFHLKARKDGIWGGVSHFQINIDTTPPEPFEPVLQTLVAAVTGRTLVSFHTTDALCGISKYEIGVIDKEKPPASPVFIEAQSPYQVSESLQADLRVIVRATDQAGNVVEGYADLRPRLSSQILVFTVFSLFLLLVILHYLFEHKILSRFLRILRLLRQSEKNDENLNQGDDNHHDQLVFGTDDEYKDKK